MNKKVFCLLGLVILLSLYRCDPVAATGNAGVAPEVSAEGTEGSGQPVGKVLEPGHGQNGDAAEKPDSGQDTTALAPDEVSSGQALMEWLEVHKNIGGSVTLTEDVVLEGAYCFCPSRPGCPSVLVDVGDHRITVAGEMEFFSDDRLTFRGQAGAGSLFYVAEGGLLSLSGVSVEAGQLDEATQYALWQEEGAGLILDNCKVQGDIHYADMPLVLGSNTVCVVAEKDQTAEDVLPVQLECNVNYQGQVQYHQLAAVLWDLAGTERQRGERLRFSVQGSFSSMAFQQQPVCTVAYHDYPLTFQKVGAYKSAGSYQFRGSYVKQEDGLPMKIASEYSPDGVNWVVYKESEESALLNPQTFFIGIADEQWNTAEQPFLYIRLRGEREGVTYLSNVLRYAADNLENVEDQGGTRGGGTSIVNPPDVPKEPGDVFPDSSGTPEGEEPPAGSGTPEGEETSAGSGTLEGGTSSAGGFQEGEETPEGIDAPDGSSPLDGGNVLEGNLFPGDRKPSGAFAGTEEGTVPDVGDPSGADTSVGNGSLPVGSLAPADSHPAAAGTADGESTRGIVVPVYAENADIPAAHISVARQQPFHGRVIAVIAGFTGLSVLGGGAAWFFHVRNK